MGKKGANTAQKKAAKQNKTDSKAEKLSKKAGKVFGNDDIDAILAEFSEQDRKKSSVITTTIEEVPPRVNSVIAVHPSNDTLIIHGGEHFNGNKVTCYKDIYSFNTVKNEYKHIAAPNAPVRSGHTAVIVNQDNNAFLYSFAGDFTSPSQLFKHYNDLWVCDLSTYKWEQIIAPNGPSIRSGHRMVLGKRALYVFGGFYDNHQSIKYFNDFFKFDLDTRKWEKLGPGVVAGSKAKMTATEIAAASNAAWPPVRSGFGFIFHEATNSLYLYGGYCTQTKKNSLEESANVLSDLWQYSLQTNTWTQLKQTGHLPAGRSACQLFTYQHHILLFGGVRDIERRIERKSKSVEVHEEGDVEGEDDEVDPEDTATTTTTTSPTVTASAFAMTNVSKKKKRKNKKDDEEDEFVLESEFSNELLEYSIKYKRWFKLNVNIGVNPLIKEDKQAAAAAAASQIAALEDDKDKEKVVEKAKGGWNWNSSKQQEQQLKDEHRALAERRKKLEEEREAALLAIVEANKGTEANDDDDDLKKKSKVTPVNYLWPRRNAMISVKNGICYLFGGAFERENVEVILNDLHFLDLKKVFKSVDLDKEYTAQQQQQQTSGSIITPSSPSANGGEEDYAGVWQCVTEADLSKFSWFEENDENDDSDEEEEIDFSDDDDDDGDDDDDEVQEKKKLRVPPIEDFDTGKDYFKSCEEFWKSEALTEAPEDISDKDLRQLAFKLAKKYYEAMKKKSQQ